MNFTQADLDNLKQALVSGATRVKIGDREVQYRSLAEIEQLIKLVSDQLNGNQTLAEGSPNMIQTGFSRGQR